jgi:hypothetical protein
MVPTIIAQKMNTKKIRGARFGIQVKENKEEKSLLKYN